MTRSVELPDAEDRSNAVATPQDGEEATVGIKRLKNFRLSGEAERLLTGLARSLAINQTAIVELAIRDYAKRHGVRGQ